MHVTKFSVCKCVSASCSYSICFCRSSPLGMAGGVVAASPLEEETMSFTSISDTKATSIVFNK